MTTTPPRTSFHNSFIHKLTLCIIDAQFRFAKTPKYARYTIALPIITILFEILDLALLAQTKTGKSQLLLLNKIDIHLRSVQIRLRILSHTKNIPETSYIQLSERMVELGKILGGWIKNTKTNLND